MSNYLNDFCGIVLSGGKSSRMGYDKSGILKDNKTFLEIQLEKIRELGLPEIIVSGKASPSAFAKSIPDITPGLGPLGGMYSCFLKCSGEYKYALVLSVDTPRVTTGTLSKLIEAHKNSNRDATVLSRDGKAEPLVAVYNTDTTDKIKTLLDGNRRSIKDYIRSIDSGFFEFTGDPRELLNCNYPEDLKML